MRSSIVVRACTKYGSMCVVVTSDGTKPFQFQFQYGAGTNEFGTSSAGGQAPFGTGGPGSTAVETVQAVMQHKTRW